MPLEATDSAPGRLFVLRGLAYAGLALAFFHVVAAAVVRVAGGPAGGAARLGGAGEASAWLLVLLLATMMAAAWPARRVTGVRGASGIIGAWALCAALLIGIMGAGATAAPLADASLAVARTLLVAALALLVLRAGGLGASDVEPGSGHARGARVAIVGVGVAFAAVALGALTARVPGAASACTGVLSCAATTAAAGARHVHVAHQALALLLVALTSAGVIGAFRRRDPAPVQRAARMALGSVLLQIAVAVALVAEALPASLRSLHAATGMLVWLSLVTSASLACRAAVVIRVPVILHDRPTQPTSIAARPRMTTAARRACTTPVAVPAILATLAVEAMGAAAEPPHVDATDASGHGAPERSATREPAEVPATAHAGETVRVAVTPGSVAAVVGGHDDDAPPPAFIIRRITTPERPALAVAVTALADRPTDIEPFVARPFDAAEDAESADDDRSITITPDAAPEVVAPAPPRTRRRPPTLAVLLARGADF